MYIYNYNYIYIHILEAYFKDTHTHMGMDQNWVPQSQDDAKTVASVAPQVIQVSNFDPELTWRTSDVCHGKQNHWLFQSPGLALRGPGSGGTNR